MPRPAPSALEFLRKGHPWETQASALLDAPRLLSHRADVRRREFEKLADGVAIIDAGNRIIHAHHAASFPDPQYVAAHVRGRLLEELVPSEILRGLMLTMDEAVAIGRPRLMAYSVYSRQFHGWLLRTALVMQLPEANQMAILTWHAGLRQFGPPPSTRVPVEGELPA